MESQETTTTTTTTPGGETLETMQARHRKEQRDLQGRITSKKKNATKKTRKFVNDECAALEYQLKEKQEEELRQLTGATDGDEHDTTTTTDVDQQQQQQQPASPPTSSSSSPDALATKLESTTLSPQSRPQQKKPNRQKARLARRAAEAEALSLAASHEASNMTDHRGAEREAMQAAFAAHALREYEIAPDGHCLFSAVADQLAANGIEGGEGGYKAVRRAAAEWILRHREEYEGFLEEGVEEYVGKVRDTAEWGGEVELRALAGCFGVEIRVVQGGGRAVEVVKPAEEGKEGKTLWLAYYRHGYGLGEHYNSLRRVKV